MREATDEVHNGLAIPQVPDSSMRERMAVANLALHSVAGIDDKSRKFLEYFKQQDAMAFEISMSIAGKSFKELSERRNDIALIAKNLWMTTTKANIAQIFIDDEE